MSKLLDLEGLAIFAKVVETRSFAAAAAEPLHLAEHVCITYGHGTAAETWRFTHKSGRSATVRPSGPRRVNNGDAMMPALIAGAGLAILPEFILREALDTGRLEKLPVDWSLPSGSVYWITLPGGLRPKRVEVLADLLFERLAPQKMRHGGVSREKTVSHAKR